ncbi:uncharacterized protein DS421_13g437770 [Arachis hypogaea]|nr:uncharacterized protein DS421_13g437770 [Arachis hypogaea]
MYSFADNSSFHKNPFTLSHNYKKTLAEKASLHRSSGDRAKFEGSADSVADKVANGVKHNVIDRAWTTIDVSDC